MNLAQELLESLGQSKDDMHLLDTVEKAEVKYAKEKKDAAAFGWDSFNQETIFKAYEKRAAAVRVLPSYSV